MPATDSTAAVEAVFRIEFPRVVAALARACGGDLGLAEELAQDSLVDALRQWPSEGTPRNPGAWLTAVGKRKAIDRFRRDRVLASKYIEVGRALEVGASGVGVGGVGDVGVGAVGGGVLGDGDGAFDDEIEDDRLRLIFVACHPVLSVPARVALTLRLVGGLTVPEIARAYLDPEATVAQRIGRAKKTIAQAGVPFEVPIGEDPRRASAPCSKSSISSTTRATPPPRARTGCAPSSAPRRCGSGEGWPRWPPTRPRCTAWSR